MSVQAINSTAKIHRLKVGIAGLGRAGWLLHFKTIAELSKHFCVSAVCDPDESRRNQAIELTKCRAYANYHEFVADSDIDLIVIATPSHLHASQAIQAMESGHHVLCDKPMAVNLQDAVRMMETSHRTEKMLSVFHLNHYAADFRNVLSVINSGILGKIAQVQIRWNTFNRRRDWQTLRSFGGGLLNNTGPHALEQALSFLSQDPQHLFFECRQMLSLGDTEDHVKIVMTSDDGPLVDIELSSVDVSQPHKWTVLGSRGSLWGCANKHTWKYFNSMYRYPEHADTESPQDRRYHVEQFAWLHGHWDLPGNVEAPAVQFYRKLYASLIHGVPPDVDLERSIRVMKLIDRCRSSTDTPSLDYLYETKGKNL